METYKEEPLKVNYPMNSFSSEVSLNQSSNNTAKSIELKLSNQQAQDVRTPNDLCSNCDHAATCSLKSVERFTYQCEHYQ